MRDSLGSSGKACQMAPPIPKTFGTPSATGQRKSRKRAKEAKKSQNPAGPKPVSRNAARERSRVRSLRVAFGHLQSCLPSVPPDTKLSKLDVLILATSYISHLSRLILEDELLQGDSDFSLVDILQMEAPCLPAPEVEARNPSWEKSYLHPVKKWPMRSRLYAGVEETDPTSSSQVLQPGQW